MFGIIEDSNIQKVRGKETSLSFGGNSTQGQLLTTLCGLSGKFIAQVARFDPSKGIPDVIRSYVLLREKLKGHMKAEETPQLLMYVSPDLLYFTLEAGTIHHPLADKRHRQ